MGEKRPLIFISNDDGYQAKGINELIKYIGDMGELVVMAPNRARSGKSSAITANHPVRYGLVEQSDNVKIYWCDGTPVDCVKLAKTTVLERKPDLLIAGINHGDNAGINAIYSGTIGAVMEGCLNGIPSIGYSVDNHSADAEFGHCSDAIRRTAQKVLDKGLPDGVCLNVNFPAEGELKGIKVCKQASGVWENEWVKQTHPRGYDYYWLTGEFVEKEPDNKESDRWAFRNGYAAVTPITVDFTAYEMIDKIKSWNL